jgi:hypothetical protein
MRTETTNGSLTFGEWDSSGVEWRRDGDMRQFVVAGCND